MCLTSETHISRPIVLAAKELDRAHLAYRFNGMAQEVRMLAVLWCVLTRSLWTQPARNVPATFPEGCV